MLKYTYNLAVMLVLMQSIVFSITNLYLPSLPKIAEYFSAEKVQIQFTVSLYFLGLFVFSLISNVVMARFGGIKTLIIGSLVFIASSILCVFSEDLLWLKICLFMIALSVGPMTIMSRALLGSINKQNRRVAMSSVYLISSLISSMVAPLIGGFISFFVWWQFVFVICAVFGVVILYRIQVFQNNNNTYRVELTNNFGDYITILSKKIFSLICGIKWTLYAASQAFYVEIPFILHNHGFNAKDIGLVIVVTGTGFVFGSFLSRLFAKSLELKRIVATAIIISMIGGGVCAYQAIVFDVYVFIFSAWVMMIGMGMSASNLMLLVLNKFPRTLHTKLSALYNMITLFMCFAVTAIVGHIANYSMDYFYVLFLILPIISMLLFLASKFTGCFKKP